MFGFDFSPPLGNDRLDIYVRYFAQNLAIRFRKIFCRLVEELEKKRKCVERYFVTVRLRLKN